MRFKVGDVVIATYTTEYITKNREYVVEYVDGIINTVTIVGDNQKLVWGDFSQFRLKETLVNPEVTEDIESPQRYNKGSIEVWDFILDQSMGFLEGNIIKYISRYKEKGGIKDLEKAKVYLEKLIEETKKNE